MKSEEQIKKEFGERLLALRNAKGWSQLQLSHESEVDTGTISKIELGKVSPKVVTAVRLAIALGCRIDDLIRL